MNWESIAMFYQALSLAILLVVLAMVREDRKAREVDLGYIRVLEDNIDELHAERVALLGAGQDSWRDKFADDLESYEG